MRVILITICALIFMACGEDKKNETSTRESNEVVDAKEHLKKGIKKTSDKWTKKIGHESERVQRISDIYPVSIYDDIFVRKDLETFKDEADLCFATAQAWISVSEKKHENGFVTSYGRMLQTVSYSNSTSYLQDFTDAYENYKSCVNSNDANCMANLEKSLMDIQYN